MDKLFRIGDVARLFHLSVSSLRHYEDEGLLVPEKIDPDTGYRYYSVRQFEVLNTIRYLRALDMPLSEIGDFLKNRDVEKIEEKLLRQKQAVAEKRRELLRIERQIDNRLARLREAQDARLGEVLLRDAPACRVVWLQKELRLNSFLDMEGAIRCLDECQSETAIFLGKVGASMSAERLKNGGYDQYDGIFLVLDDEDRYEGETILLLETLCATVRFRGSHPEAPAQYARMMDYMQAHGLEIAGFSREITLIDYGLTSDPDKFVTEISIPVKKNRAEK